MYSLVSGLLKMMAVEVYGLYICDHLGPYTTNY